MSTDFNTAVLLTSGNIRTPRCRLTYPSLLTPGDKERTAKGGEKYRPYTTGVLIPPTADISLMKSEARRAALEVFTEEKIKDFQKLGRWHSPFLDAYEKSKTERKPDGDEQFKGWTLIRLSTKTKPQVIDRHGNNVDDEAEVYGGRWAFVSISPHAYPSIDGGKPGASFYLQNVQLLDHDDRLGGGGRVSAEAEFAPVTLPDDDGDSGSGGASSEDMMDV